MAPDTIYALSSGRPPAAIAIIRISGPDAHAAASALVSGLPDARQAAVRQLRHRRTGELLDEALVLRFDAPASATGDDLVEFHCHGGRAVVEGVLGALEELDGTRLAEPGEFTRRALANGRIDLTEAEGLADLLEAETESQRRAALLMAEGGLSRQIDSWRRHLVDLSARAEAAIDYVEEDSVDSDLSLETDCADLAGEIGQWLSKPRAEPLRDGLTVVIGGPPNAGKSSLLNALSGMDRAIVTAIPGTTRDHIEVSIALGGVPIRLIDTAGIRETNEPVEKIGVGRSRRLMDVADIMVWLGEPGEAPQHPRLIAIFPKCDLESRAAAGTRLPVSATTGQGISQLIEAIIEQARSMLPAEGQIALNRRQFECLGQVHAALQQSESAELPIIAEHLREARAAVDRLTGHRGVEDVLDALFGRFCLGK